jgi:SAM-dependent methyltransferase
MHWSIDRYVREKRQFYGRREVSQSYERQRFSGSSGQWVNGRELDIVKSLLVPNVPNGSILDLACGTGRLSLHLAVLGYQVVGLDSSAEMLAVARAKVDGDKVIWVQGDAFALPVASASFDAVVALRFAFHFPKLEPLLSAVAGVLKPGGAIVLDTYNWSPRALAPLGKGAWGSRVHTHHPDTVLGAALSMGLDLVEKRACFLFSPYLYRLLPLRVAIKLGQLEPHVPPSLRARVFWHFQLLW